MSDTSTSSGSPNSSVPVWIYVLAGAIALFLLLFYLWFTRNRGRTLLFRPTADHCRRCGYRIFPGQARDGDGDAHEGDESVAVAVVFLLFVAVFGAYLFWRRWAERQTDKVASLSMRGDDAEGGQSTWRAKHAERRE
ncbi:hypothetical protein Q5752_006752 [Cryptotrichosporon argae]